MKTRKPVDSVKARALQSLRRGGGFILKEIVPDIGVSQQILSRWENGQANIPEEKLALFLKAIGRTEGDLVRTMNEVREPETPFRHQFQVQAQSGSQAMSASFESWHVSDESMSPWCEPGEVVLFHRGEHPRRLEGCLVEMKSGERLIRLYERERDGFIFLHRVNPDCTEQFLHSDIAGLHRISFRGKQ